ncbi:hypothetical protein ACO2Q8_21585 [Larkinella sp. VNQ87]|uniref:hypothetical protein n=1 Tax=Larkinella sp. VNQ87 TaxID=3400921 RepID=UPI003C0079C6
MEDGHKKVLIRQKFQTIKAGLQEYRLDKFIRMLESQPGKNKGNILPFVRGLRFSALLIYTIREFLQGTGLTASWGHIIDENGVFCSRECDIIIHREGHIMRWNGDGGIHPVMDFKFIEQEDTIAVISCKSYLEKSHIEKEYCEDLKKYVSKVWLFSECCPPDKVATIREAAAQIGYESFWSLYTWDRTTDAITDLLEDWENFVSEVKRLGGK